MWIKRTAVKKRRSKPRPGRLKGKDLTELRNACFARDRGICAGCKLPVDPNDWHMAHIRNKRMWGDHLDNVETKHPYCHLVLGHNPKSVPKKPSTERIDYGSI